MKTLSTTPGPSVERSFSASELPHNRRAEGRQLDLLDVSLDEDMEGNALRIRLPEQYLPELLVRFVLLFVCRFCMVMGGGGYFVFIMFLLFVHVLRACIICIILVNIIPSC